MTPSHCLGYSREMRRIGLLIPILVLVTSCEEPVTAPASPRLSFTVTPATVAPGDSFVVEFTLQNPTRQTLTVTSGSGCLFFLQVTRVAEPVSVRGLSYGCLAVVTTFHVKPFGSLKVVRHAVADERTGVGVSSPLPVGQYKIQTIMLAPLPDQEATLTVV